MVGPSKPDQTAGQKIAFQWREGHERLQAQQMDQNCELFLAQPSFRD